MKNLETETMVAGALEEAVPIDSPLFDPAHHVRHPIPDVQPIRDVDDFLETLPHIAPDDDGGFYEAILDLRRRRRSIVQEKSQWPTLFWTRPSPVSSF